MIREILAELAARHDLPRERAAAAMGEIVEGRATPAQIGAFLMALRVKGETVDEIVGCATALRARMRRIRSPDPATLDTCGTGGDGLGTFNLSTAVAFVAAGAGATVAKHGNHGVSSRCGSADLLARAGFALEAPPERIEQALARARVAFLYAPRFHPAVRHAVAPRRELGLRTVFNALGPLANPAGVRRQVLGVYDRALLTPLAHALRELGSEHVMVVHSVEGLDELSPAGETFVAELRNGRVTERVVAPEDAGLARRPLSAIAGGSAEENLAKLRALLEGRGEAALEDAVVLNAAAALVVAGRAGDLREGAILARRALRGGAAAEAFERARAIQGGEP